MCSASASPPPSVSAVVVSHNEGADLRLTVQNLLATLPADAELIVVDDASTDDSAGFLGASYPTVQLLRPPERQGVARARNFGAAAATGHVIVHLDAHVETPFGWIDAITDELAKPGVGAVGPAVVVMGNAAARGYGFTWQDAALTVDWLGRQDDQPYPVPMLGGFCIAMRRDLFEECGGFDHGLDGWGAEDAELSFRLWSMGFECRVLPDVAVGHQFRERLPHLKRPGAVVQNYLRLGAVHFSASALTRLVDSYRDSPYFAEAIAGLLDGDASVRRADMRARRVRDDTWFFDRFGIGAFNGNEREVQR